MRATLLALLALAALVPFTSAAPQPAFVVAAAGFHFEPPAGAVPLGVPVRWEGILLPHTVTTAADAEAMAEGDPDDARNEDADPDTFNVRLRQGQSFTHTFTKPGLYYYYCEPHIRLGMVGVIEVVG